MAVADAGLETAIYRLNTLKPSALMCVAVGAPYLVLEPVLGTGWCTQSAEEQLGDGASFSYRMSAGATLNLNGQGLLQRKIVATGRANGVTRRVMATVGSLTGISVFGGNAVTSSSTNDLVLQNSASIIGNAATNGSVSLQGTSQLCGNALVGPGEVVTPPAQQCPGFASVQATQQLILNPVNQGAATTTNDNGRIGNQDPFVLPFLSSWNPATRVLRLRGTSILTLTGNTYSFCYLEIENQAQLIIAARLPTQAPLKIYMDAPENCPGVTDAGSVRLLNTGSIANLNATSNTLQIFAMGSPQTATSIEFQNSVSTLVGLIYAPRSTVTLRNSNAILGSVAAQTVALQNSARVEWHPSADVTLDNLFPLFKRTGWVECASKQLGSAPDSDC